jgi:hypothetical protein
MWRVELERRVDGMGRRGVQEMSAGGRDAEAHIVGECVRSGVEAK